MSWTRSLTYRVHKTQVGTMNGKNRIMMFGPKDDGPYVVEFRTAEGETLAISIPGSEGDRANHSTNSSARSCNSREIVRPSAFAVFKLITSSYFVGACTGKLPGFSPLRMRST
jgi:hypothetical protein